MRVTNISGSEKYLYFGKGGRGLRLADGASGEAPDDFEARTLAIKYESQGLITINDVPSEAVVDNQDAPAPAVIKTASMVAGDEITLAGTNASGAAFTYTFTVLAAEDGNATERTAGMNRLKTEINANADLDSIGVKATALNARSATIYELTLERDASSYPVSGAVTLDSPDTTVSFAAGGFTIDFDTVADGDIFNLDGYEYEFDTATTAATGDEAVTLGASDTTAVTALAAAIEANSDTLGFSAEKVDGEDAIKITPSSADKQGQLNGWSFTDAASSDATVVATESYLVGGADLEAVRFVSRTVTANGTESTIVTGLDNIVFVNITAVQADGSQLNLDGVATITGGTIHIDDDGSVDLALGDTIYVFAAGQ